MQITSNTLLPDLQISRTAVYATRKNISVFDHRSGKIQQNFSKRTLCKLTIVDDMLYITYLYTDEVFAIKASDGQQDWFYQVKGKLSSSPIVKNGVVYICTLEGTIYALQAKTGTLLWQFRAGPMIFASPTIFEDVLYIVQISETSQIYSLDTSTGSLIWRTPIHTPGRWPLAASHGYVFMSAPDLCFALQASNGALVWKQDFNRKIYSQPVIANDRIYLSNSESSRIDSKAFMSSLRMSDGQIMWDKQIGESTHAHRLTAPVIANKRVYFGSNDGHLNVLAIEDGSVQWRYKTNGTNLSSPVVSETIVYTGVNDNHIYALDLEGNLLWKSSLPEVLEVDLQDIE